MQLKGPRAHAVFLTVPKESLVHHYERQADDPRVAQKLILAVDAYGNIGREVAINYPRRQPAHAEQGALLADEIQVMLQVIHGAGKDVCQRDLSALIVDAETIEIGVGQTAQRLRH